MLGYKCPRWYRLNRWYRLKSLHNMPWQTRCLHHPGIGEFLICLFVRPDRQVDRLADFAGLFRTVWLPRFGPRLAVAVYLANMLWSLADVVKITAIGAIVDFVSRLLGR